MFKVKKNQENPNSLETSPISTVIAPEITVEGNISGDAVIKIDGKVKGNVTVTKGIILGEKSEIDGDVKSGNVVIYGKVNGHINSNELIIKKSGLVHGDIQTQTIQIELGGIYNGKLTMSERTASQSTDATPKK